MDFTYSPPDSAEQQCPACAQHIREKASLRVMLMQLVESLMGRNASPPLTRLAQALTLLGHTAASNDQVRQVADRIEELEVALGRTPPKPEAQPAKPKRWAPWARG